MWNRSDNIEDVVSPVHGYFRFEASNDVSRGQGT
jgi:hypothetical protein